MGPTPVGRGLADGFTEHREGEKSLGEFREVSEDGGSRPNRLRKVLPRGGPGGAPIWVGNLGFDVRDVVKTREGTCGFLAEGCGDKGSKDGG